MEAVEPHVITIEPRDNAERSLRETYVADSGRNLLYSPVFGQTAPQIMEIEQHIAYRGNEQTDQRFIAHPLSGIMPECLIFLINAQPPTKENPALFSPSPTSDAQDLKNRAAIPPQTIPASLLTQYLDSIHQKSAAFGNHPSERRRIWKTSIRKAPHSETHPS